MQRYVLSKELYLWAAGYFAATTLFQWWFHPTIAVLWYLVGGIIGLHLLEGMERLFGGKASSFRTVISQATLTILTLFVLTSSANRFGQGVVLFMNLRYFYEQYTEVMMKRSLAPWFQGIALSLRPDQQRSYLILLACLLLGETLLFILV